MKNKRLLIIVLGLFSACANPYRANFNPTLDRFPPWTQSRFAPPAGAPRLIETDDIKAENRRLFQQGYVMVGYAKFDAPLLDTALALQEAARAQADVVLVEKKYSKTLTETETTTYWPPSETTEVRTTGSRGNRQVNTRTEITTSKGPETVYVPKRVDYYEHSATYWRKIAKPLFGALVQDLSDEQKKTLQSNRGLAVKAVMTGSPAYEADLLPDDIILEVNGTPVSGAKKFYDDLFTLSGKTLDLKILRGQSTFTRKTTLNP